VRVPAPHLREAVASDPRTGRLGTAHRDEYKSATRDSVDSALEVNEGWMGGARERQS
jgi:hypothetical protein